MQKFRSDPRSEMKFVRRSYLQCMLLDPGTVPESWHRAISVSPDRVKYKVEREREFER
jgi:hypothetical protein